MIIKLAEFSLFIVLQALAINGIFESCRGGCVKDLNGKVTCTGNIIYMICPSFFEKYKNSYWAKPFFACVRCMSSFWGGVTFWSAVLISYGFFWQEIPLYVFDVFILVTLNYIIYKKT